MHQHNIVLMGGLLAAVAGCSDDPVSYSAPVGINLKAKSSDTVNGVVTDEKGISTESGNPYGKFINDAEAELGGASPARLELTSTSLLLGAGSTGVASFGEIFDGDVDILFVTNDSNNTYPAATGSFVAATNGGPISMTSTFDSSDVSADDFAKFLGGSFKVALRGPAATDFETKGADADLQVTLTFAAYE